MSAGLNHSNAPPRACGPRPHAGAVTGALRRVCVRPRLPERKNHLQAFIPSPSAREPNRVARLDGLDCQTLTAARRQVKQWGGRSRLRATYLSQRPGPATKSSPRASRRLPRARFPRRKDLQQYGERRRAGLCSAARADTTARECSPYCTPRRPGGLQAPASERPSRRARAASTWGGDIFAAPAVGDDKIVADLSPRQTTPDAPDSKESRVNGRAARSSCPTRGGGTGFAEGVGQEHLREGGRGRPTRTADPKGGLRACHLS